MADLVAWLGVQLDEDAARAPQWHDLECEIHARMNSGLMAAVAAGRMLDEVPGAVCDCGGPARVLREIDAKRQTLKLHRQAQPKWCVICDVPGDYEGRAHGCTTLRLLALPYADRPGYRDDWRP